MIAIFESILPIFLLMGAGNLLRRAPIIEDAAWPGLESLGYWFLYPALLFTTIYRADFSGLSLDSMLAALAIAIALMIAFLLGLWPLLRRSGSVARSEYSSVFQTALRWNGFMALAIAQRTFPPEGSAVVALVMATIIIPINLASVTVVSRFGDRNPTWPGVIRAAVTNPMVVASLAALLMREMPFGIYDPLQQTLDFVARAALGMGLIAIGAGLQPGDLLRPRLAMWLPVVLKLAVFPAALMMLGIAFGLTEPQLGYLVLCGAVPTAMNGFVLARQYGGDAELYAATVTLQTALSFFTIPVVLAIGNQLASG